MANYCEVEFYETEKLVRATASPVGFFEWWKLVWTSIKDPKKVQFRVTIDKKYWDEKIEAVD
jgi:hypothetical protein